MNKKRKIVYIARHGESISNTGNIRGNTEARLTKKGIKQSFSLAYKCSTLKVDILYSSQTQRAKETAEIVAKICKLPVNYINLLNERRLPSEIKGKPKGDIEVNNIDREIRKNFHIKNYRFSDEENFNDLKSRSLKVIELLHRSKEEIFLLITHGIFARILIACAIFGRNLTGHECEMFIRGLRMEKTGITTLTLNTNLQEEGIASSWQLWSWNTYDHLETKEK